MMGACFECLVEVDGRTVQACMTPVTAGAVFRKPTNLDSAIGDGDEAL